jgi:hypothetical protein
MLAVWRVRFLDSTLLFKIKNKPRQPFSSGGRGLNVFVVISSWIFRGG